METLKKPITPKQNLVVDENNLAILEAATKVCHLKDFSLLRRIFQLGTRRRTSLLGMQKEKEEQKKDVMKKETTKTETKMEQKPDDVKTTLKVESKPEQQKIPKSEGAAATKIRNVGFPFYFLLR